MGAKNRRSEDEKNTRNKQASSKPVTSLPVPKESESRKLPNIKLLLVCATCCGLVNSYHVSSLFENDRHFSHLSNLEREMTFRTEMGFYYSHYKTIIESESFIAGLNKLMYDNKTEYPDTINTLQRFNIFPEVVLGGTYRAFTSILSSLDIPLPKVCWQVSRGDSLDPVISCEGIGDPVYWYLSGVWVCAGFTAALLFLSGAQLSRSVAGGFITVICFFFNHGEATRVQWTPPLRESFAFPFSLALNIILTYSLRRPRVSWVQTLLFGNLALNYLLCWQFAQFTLVANIGLLYGLYTVGLSPPLPMLLTLLGALYALVNALIIQFANHMLLASPLAAILIGVLLLYVFIEPLLQTLPHPTNIGAQLAFLFISSLASKIELSRMLSVEDDRHIVNLLASKFTNYSDFHTKLYTCSNEFDFLPKATLGKYMETLLLPCVLVSVGAVMLNVFSNVKKNFIKRIEEREEGVAKTSVWSGVDPGVIYNLLLLLVYAVMAGLFMRLKLFLTPQLCVFASILASRRFWQVIKRKKVHYIILAVLVGNMGIYGVRNIAQQRSVVRDYREPNLEELLHWVNAEVGQEAAFAGPMPVMANILLSTRRPIVNHPHYESSSIRRRTKAVYSLFSRRSAADVYETMLSMKVSYVVLEEFWCLRKSKPGCGILDLWDKQEPQNAHRPPLCPKLFHHNASPFHKVFSNDNFVVLQVPSKYVEIPAPRVHSS